MEIWNNYLLQLGSMGLMLTFLLIAVRYMFNYIMAALREKEIEIKQVQNQFFEHLKSSERELLSIIKEHTIAYNKLISIFEKNKI